MITPMNKKLILLVALLSGISVVAMEDIKEMLPGKEASRNEEETRVKICLTDYANYDILHEVEIPVRLAKLIGALNELVEDPKTKDSVFPLSNMTLVEWRLIEAQLERVYGITQDEINAVPLRKEISAEYEKLDAKGLIGLIHALDYADIPLLLAIACDEVKKSDLGKVSFEQINSLPEDMGNRIILDKILRLGGPMFAKEFALGMGPEGRVCSVCVTKDGKIVSGSGDKTVRVWDMQGKELAICRGHEDPVLSVCVTKDGKIISGSFDTTIRVRDIQGKALAICTGHEDLVYSVCVTNDGKIVSGSSDKTVRVWDMQGNQLAICRGHAGPVYSVCVAADGKIVSGSWDRTIRIWDMQGTQLEECRGHEEEVRSVCVTNDGKIVSGSKDKTVRVWDMQGNQLAICRGHEEGVTSVCVTKDDKIMSGSYDKTVRVWDMQGNQLAICRGHEFLVISVCVASDGNIVSGSGDKTVRVWDIGLLSRIVHMDEDHARVLWKLLHSISQAAQIGKQELWKEIEKILGEDVQVAQAIANNNNE